MANISNINDFFVVDSAGLKAVVGADLANGNGSPYVGTDFTVVGRDASSPVANLWLSNFTHKSYILISDNSSNFIIRDSAAGNRLTIDTDGNSTFAGNVGIGITPGASFSGLEVLQLGKGMTIFGNTNDDRATMAANLIVNTGTAFEYVMDGLAGRFSIEDGYMIWGTAPTGTAGQVATVTTRMTLMNDGRVGIGVTPSYANAPLHTKNIGGGDSFNIFEGIGNAWVFGEADQTGTKYCQVAGRYGHHSGINVDLVGNVGIGTVSPTGGKLEVQQTATTPGLLVQTGGTTASYVVADFRTGTNALTLRVLGNSEVVMNSIGQKANRINSGYWTAADNADIWINYEGYANDNLYYRNFNIGNGRNGAIATFNGSTGRAYFSGNVGIGQTGPGQKLVIGNYDSVANGTMRITALGGQFTPGTTRNSLEFSLASAPNVNSGDAWKFSIGLNSAAGNQGNYASDFVIRRTTRLGVTDNVDFMIDGTTGNVGIGTTLPANKLDVKISTGNRTTLEPIMSVSASGNGPYTGFGPKISFSSNIYYGASTGNPAGIIETAYIGAVMGSDYANDSDLVFGTRQSATTVSEKMRLTAKGGLNLLPDTSSRGFYSTQNPGNFSIAYTAWIANASTKVLDVLWYGSTIGSISVNASGNGVNYNTTSSDERLKKNITNWDENILDKFKDIKPKEFHFHNQDDSEEKIKGYIAQNEVDKFPEAYPLVYNEEVKEDRHLFNPSGMVVYLMKAIQELKAEIEILKNK